MLTSELVSQSCWFSNVRDHVDKATWDVLRRATYKKAGYRCEVCKGRGDKWPVECHEVWHYDDQSLVQKLVGLVALCPSCHAVKHLARAQIDGVYEEALEHLGNVNKWSKAEVDAYVAGVWETFHWRSQQQWTLDLTYLQRYGLEVKPKR
jgi:hypothetical protein